MERSKARKVEVELGPPAAPERAERAAAATLAPELVIGTDAQGRPLIERMTARIGDLEHRLDYLEREYDPDKAGRGRSRMLGEIFALRVAIRVCRYYEMEVGGEHSVITALERLVKASRAARGSSDPAAGLELLKALAHADDVLAELG